MEQATTIGIDLAKRSFQLHGAGPEESVAFLKRLSGAAPDRPRLPVASVHPERR